MSDETLPAPAAPRPDALQIPTALIHGQGQGNRSKYVKVKHAIPILGGTLESRVSVVPEGTQAFVTLDGPDPANGDMGARLGFPDGHPLAGQPQYRWETQPDGIQFGYLVPAAVKLREKRLATRELRKTELAERLAEAEAEEAAL